jgi:hypothetical protein
MLANLSKVNCYNGTGMSEELRQRMMLESAIENLKNMSFFGLTEYQRDTQHLTCIYIQKKYMYMDFMTLIYHRSN